MMQYRKIPLSLAALLALTLAACGSSDTVGTGNVVVLGLAEGQTVACSSSNGNGSASTVLVNGSGFLSEHGDTILVTWTATEGTPFDGGTSATAETSGTVLSDTQAEVQVPPGFGSFEVTVTIALLGGNDGTSPPFSLTIGGVLVGPFAQPDAFDGTIGNVPTTVAAPGVLQNDIPIFCASEDETTDRKPADGSTAAVSDFIVITPPMGFEDDATPGVAKATQLGGTVTIQADGSFVYSPPVGVTEQTDSFFYWMQEGASNASRSLVNLPISNIVWFLDLNDDGSNTGHFDNPYQSIADFMNEQGGGTGLPAPGHTIFIYDQGDNDPYDGLLRLLDDQTLLGEGFGLTIDTREIVPAGTRPILVNSQFAIGESQGDTVIQLADRNTVRGLEIQAPNLHGIYGFDVSGPTLIDDCHIQDSLSSSIRLQSVSGPFQVGTLAAPGTMTVTIDGSNWHGIEISGGQVPVLRTGLASGPTLNVINTGITNIDNVGIDAFDTNVTVTNCELDNCNIGILLETFNTGTCSFQVDDTQNGANTPHRYRGIVLDPFAFGSGIDARISNSTTISNEEALWAGSVEGGNLVIALEGNTWQNILADLVATNIPAVLLQGAVEGGSTVVRQMDNELINGNNAGGGIICEECTFDADPATMAIEPVSTTSLQIGSGAAGRVLETALQFFSCFGELQIGTLTIWQLGGNAAGYDNMGLLTLTITTEVIDVASP